MTSVSAPGHDSRAARIPSPGEGGRTVRRGTKTSVKQATESGFVPINAISDFVPERNTNHSLGTTS